MKNEEIKDNKKKEKKVKTIEPIDENETKNKNKNKNKNKKKIIKTILIILICVIVVGGLLTAMIISGKKTEERIDNISFYVSNDYSCFNVSIDDFYDKVKYKYKNENITANLKEYTEDDYQYVIELSNNDFIYIKTKNKKVAEIKYDFSKNLDGGKLGYFIGMFSVNAIPSIETDSFQKQINDEFLNKEDLFEKEQTLYVYKHILYEMNLTFGSTTDYINKAIFIIKPTEYETNKEYQEYLKIEQEKKAAEEKRKEEERLKKEAEEKEAERLRLEQEERERQEQLAQKNRTFTAGTYTVGTDIEPGTYNMVAVSGRGNCYVKSSSRVIETFTPGGDRWAIDSYKNVVLTAGGTIEVTSTLQIRFEAVK